MGNQTVSPTAEQHNETRRAAKKRQRKNRGNSQPMSGFSAGLGEDRRQAREAAAAAREARRADEHNFRVRQSELAAKLLSSDLFGLSEEVARVLIDAFPGIVPPRGTNRTNAAEAQVRGELSDEDRGRTKAVTVGISTARKALREAFDQLRP